MHMIMVPRIQSRYCNHQSRGNLNGTGSVISNSQIRKKLDRLLSNQPSECVSEKESEVNGAFKWQEKCLFSGKNTYNPFLLSITKSYYSKYIIL